MKQLTLALLGLSLLFSVVDRAAAQVAEAPQRAAEGSSFPEIVVGDVTYRDVQVTAVYPDRISITHAGGLASILFEQLPETLQKQFGYDPVGAAHYQKSEQERRELAAKLQSVQNELALERQRKAAEEEAKARETAAAQPQATPVSRQAPGGDNPAFNGFPLSEILRGAVVSNTRAPVYAISGGDQALQATVAEINGRYSGRLDYHVAGAERYARMKELASGAFPGRVMGHVRAGMILKTLFWRHTESAPVLLPKTLGVAQFGSVRSADFYPLGSRNTRDWWNGDQHDPLPNISEINQDSFLPYQPTDRTQIFDPFEGTEIILANTDHEIQRMWLVDGQQINGLPLVVAETRDGLFLGAASEKDLAGPATLTWDQTVADKTRPYFLKVKQTRDLPKGAAVFPLYDSDSPMRRKIATSNVQDFILFPEAHAELLTKGAWTLKTNFMIPKGAGFEPVQEVDTQASFQFEIERKLDRIQLVFDSLAENAARFLVTSDFERREVERTAKTNGRETVVAKPWRKQKEQLTSEVQLAADGGLRFTDGECIYALTKGRLKDQLVIYTVEKSGLKK